MDKSKDKPSSGTGTNNNSNVPAKPKEKRRSNEKRKEKSRDAARCRRSRETEIFTELAHVLPIRREDVEQLDKASIMRLSIAFLKVREMLKLFPKVENLPSEDKVKATEDDEIKPFEVWNNPEHQKMFTQALDGFLMILSSEGDVTYVSENISDFLGISQIDILGQQIWEYSHQCDHDELKEALNVRKNNSVEIKKEDSEKENNLTTEHRDFFLRLKCTLTSRGRSVNIKSASYKVIHVTGHLVMNDAGERILIAIGRPLPHPSNIEIPLGSTTFLTKHSLDMKFTYVDDKMLSLLGYQPEDLLGKSLYDCHHGGDSESLMTTFKSVLSKGQGETCRHRFLGKLGGYCWIVTQATIVYDKQKPQSVVCVNYVISDIENNNEIYSCSQLEAYNKENDTKQQLLQKTQQLEQDNQQKQQNNTEKSDKSDDCCKLNIQQVIKQQQQQQQKQQQQQQQLDEKLSDKPTIINNNNNSNNLIKIDNKNYRESSLSPIRRTLNNCSISKSPSIINSTIIDGNSVAGGIVKLSQPLMQKQEKRPKSVTASVFTQVRVPDKNLFLNNTTAIPVATTAATVNIAPKAQSVTASVFTPLSALPPNTIQNLPNRFLLSAGSGNTTKTFIQQQRSEDMNKGYLPFSEDTPDLTMLKEEPDDLTHLAPTAGDACIPLDESTPLFGEMLENLMLPDSYALLPDDISSLDSQQSNCNNSSNNNKNQIDLDPFINYRDESSDTNSSPHLLSPGGASKSPEVSSLPSLCSPNSLSQEEEFAFMTMNVEDDIDLSMRAPYIPMNEQEDLPLLTDDLMWSAFSEELTLHKDIKEALQMEAIKNSNNNNNNMTASAATTAVGTTNSNDVNNESSLAALLCSNSLQQQQAAEQISDQINDSNKKRKFDQSDSGTNLVDSIEAYGQAFSKNSTNDCWTMNDLLQINSAQNSTTLTHSNNIRPEKQSIIVNTVIPAQIHMPLITIQNNTTNNNKDNICRTNSPTGFNKSNSNNTTPNNNSNNNNNNTSGKNNVIINDNINRKFLTRIINATTPDGGSIKNGCTVNIIGNGDLSNTITSNKRHLNTSGSLDTKRVKNSSSVEMQTSPQLLQQLMAPTPQRQKVKSSYDKSQSTRWTTDGGGSQSSGNMSSTTPSNSVLKNLLVSGCDVSLSSRPPDIVMSDESSRDSIQDPLQMSPGSGYFTQPLHCKTSTVQLIRHFGSNPLIGGVGMLPSPPIPTPIDDLSPPGLISINDCDSSSDSGIECNIQNSYINERNSKFSTNYPASNVSSEPGGCISTTGTNMGNRSPVMKTSKSGTEEPPPTPSESRKMSFSFLDDQNPLCSPFLMELGNDDYEMNESINADFLQDNELTKVLTEWTYEMT